jgi:hypothetical protein
MNICRTFSKPRPNQTIPLKPNSNLVSQSLKAVLSERLTYCRGFMLENTHLSRGGGWVGWFKKGNKSREKMERHKKKDEREN